MKNKNYDKKTQTAEGIEVGTIVHDEFDEGLRFIIMRGPFHWCGYIGIPKDYPLAGFGYDDISFVSAHGGLTFAEKGEKEYKQGEKKGQPYPWPEGYYWYGWDYGHAGDRSHYDSDIKGLEKFRENNHDWTIQEVIDDSWETLYDFKRLMKFAEKIANKRA